MGVVRWWQASGRITAASSVAWTDRHNFKKLPGPGSLGRVMADPPVRKILHGRHLIADLKLPYGEALHDYLA